MTRTETKNDLRYQIAKFVNNGLFLICEHLGRQNSRDFRRLSDEQSRIIHIFDTDVIVTACAPWRTGPRQDTGSGGYGTVLPNVAGDGQATTEIGEKHETELARLLAEFALLRSADGKGDPDLVHGIFQLGAHYEETADIYYNVRNNAERASGDSSVLAARQREAGFRGRLGALISSRMQSTDDPKAHLQLAEKLVRILNEQKVPSGRSERAIAEWDNFLTLNRRSGGLYQIDEVPHVLALSADEALAPELANAFKTPLPNPHDEFERDLYSEIEKQWTLRLGRFKRKANVNDIRSIAEIFILNYRLMKLGSRSYRVVFVTGDRNLCIASYDDIKLQGDLLRRLHIDLSNSGFEDPNAIADGYLESFAFHHIRHLWAYLEESVLTPANPRIGPHASPSTPDVADMEWLHGLLAKWSRGERFRRRDLVDLLQALDDPDGNRVKREEFGETISRLVEDPTIRAEFADAVKRFKMSLVSNIENKDFQSFQRYADLLPKIVRRFHEASRSGVRKDWGEIVKMVSDDVARQDDATVVSLSNVGVGVLLAARRSESRVTKRNPPPLLFDRFKTPKIIVDALSRVPDQDELGAFEKAYQAIPGECRELIGNDSPETEALSTYLRYLVLGVLFASARRWGVAYSHAARAIEIIGREKKNFGLVIPVNGREAYFLAASTKRMIAHRSSDYDIVARYLNLAKEAYFLDAGFPHMKEESKIAHELRLASEELALALSRYYFERSRDPGLPFTALARDVCDAAERAIKRQDEAMARLKVAHAADLGKLVEPIIITSLATNLLQVRTSNEFRFWQFGVDQPLCPVDNARILDALAVMNSLTCKLDERKNYGNNLDRRILKTTLMHCYELMGKLVVFRDGIDIPGGIPNIAPLEDAAADFGIASYDRWRHEVLLKFARHLRDELKRNAR